MKNGTTTQFTPKSMAQSTYGFTLFEMMIALTLLAILTGYGMPAYKNLKMNKTMTSSINQLIAGISYARNQSIIRTEQLIVCPAQNASGCLENGEWHTGWMVFIDENMNRKFDGKDEILTAENQMHKSLEAQSSTYRKLIRFDKFGGSPGTNMTISFCDSRGSEYAKSIVLSNVGRPRVSPNGRCG